MRSTCAELAAWCGGELHGDAGRRVTGVSTDSRTLRPGDLFVALVGEQFDGHRFVGDALARGAAGVLVARDVAAGDAACIRVEDTLVALAALGAEQRRRFAGPVIAITGSNGKTTTKEMCAALLAAAGRRVQRSPASFNNAVGLPLSILALEPDDEVLVLELGMNHPGELDALARIAAPTIGAITQVAPAHVGPVGSLEAIARAKGELLDHLDPQGTAVLNADDAGVLSQAHRFAGRQLRFGFSLGSEVRAEETRAEAAGSSFRLVTPGGTLAVRLRVPGRHMVVNALCAAACALASDALGPQPLESLRAGLETFDGLAGRLALRRGARGSCLLDDSYNANPASVEAALATLQELARGGRAIAVLGDMLELGEEAPRWHEQIGRAAAAAGVDVLVAVGPLSAATARAAREAGVPEVEQVEDAKAAAERLQDLVGPGDTVLVKASRRMRLEQTVAALEEAD
jgi:UDP-N-acetylmuramoyl-tripeptide--D-alanyl-D-alanine ligase